ncbi:ubiquinol-cytochrome-c reductase complex assembly factor 3 [Callorhinchus milii]|uniref:ubiquinol-cytochrome-c reductase complex assembly factor 3 n=1 Tax=Callorhinchus milii TaxID=7868 RepID=UPI0004573332|nr:ubiquinol-cytochrome-c reductase complex assembly factor 3 [Callorhinchus milii]|eukprot:gi/632990119/ref/XP_007884011.1/ PREDICTED: UPF0723 protein C11orf83 homolog [Callorhinchus milii]
MRLLKAGVWLLVGTGAAALCWAVAAPGPHRSDTIRKELPESNPLRKRETDRRNALVMQVIKEAAETEENVAWRTDWRK